MFRKTLHCCKDGENVNYVKFAVISKPPPLCKPITFSGAAQVSLEKSNLMG